ncbi:hypothetical protein [Caloramator sp. ALD01]|uniref:hypothetical protein n=1 Tax=Caloramator sp. ALD01 TaxID=1031288 RepID=UPI00041E0374|nr:hypothetical protein [Caloramator sp. ALD01]
MNSKNNERIVGRILYKPIKIVMLYFICLIILYTWGPLEWRTENPIEFYIFLLLSQGLIYIGYTKTIKKMYKKDAIFKYPGISYDEKVILKWLKVLIVINLIISCMFLIRTIGISSFSIYDIINSFYKGITDPGVMYNSKFTNEKIFGGKILAPIYTLMSPVLWPVLPLSIIYYKQLSFVNKTLIIMTIIIEIIRWVSIGTNKGIVELILIIIAILFLKQWQKMCSAVTIMTSKRSKHIRVVVITTVLIMIGLFLFQNNVSSRLNNSYYIVSAITNNTEINLESPLIKVTPIAFQPLLVYITQYLTQGYYGLSLTLNEPFIPMFGIGNSYFLIANFQELFNLDLWKYTYQARIAYKGWDPFINWHSIYSWLANDVSYLGVLVIMFLLGKYYAIVCYRSIRNKDPITSVIFCLLVICFFYFPANNQILSTPSTFMAFWGLNIYWFYKTKIKRVK